MIKKKFFDSMEKSTVIPACF